MTEGTTCYCIGLFVATTAMFAAHILGSPAFETGVAIGFYFSLVLAAAAKLAGLPPFRES